MGEATKPRRLVHASLLLVLLSVAGASFANGQMPPNPCARQWDKMIAEARARRPSQDIAQLLAQTDVVVLKDGREIRGCLYGVREYFVDITVEDEPKPESFRVKNIRRLSGSILVRVLQDRKRGGEFLLKHLRKKAFVVEGATDLLTRYLRGSFARVTDTKSRKAAANWSRVAQRAIELLGEQANDDILAFEAVADILSNRNLVEQRNVQKGAAAALTAMFDALPDEHRAPCAHHLLDTLQLNLDRRLVSNGEPVAAAIAATVLPDGFREPPRRFAQRPPVDQRSLPPYASRAAVGLAGLLTLQSDPARTGAMTFALAMMGPAARPAVKVLVRHYTPLIQTHKHGVLTQGVVNVLVRTGDKRVTALLIAQAKQRLEKLDYAESVPDYARRATFIDLTEAIVQLGPDDRYLDWLAKRYGRLLADYAWRGAGGHGATKRSPHWVAARLIRALVLHENWRPDSPAQKVFAHALRTPGEGNDPEFRFDRLELVKRYGPLEPADVEVAARIMARPSAWGREMLASFLGETAVAQPALAEQATAGLMKVLTSPPPAGPKHRRGTINRLLWIKNLGGLRLQCMRTVGTVWRRSSDQRVRRVLWQGLLQALHHRDAHCVANALRAIEYGHTQEPEIVAAASAARKRNAVLKRFTWSAPSGYRPVPPTLRQVAEHCNVRGWSLKSRHAAAPPPERLTVPAREPTMPTTMALVIHDSYKDRAKVLELRATPGKHERYSRSELTPQTQRIQTTVAEIAKALGCTITDGAAATDSPSKLTIDASFQHRGTPKTNITTDLRGRLAITTDDRDPAVSEFTGCFNMVFFKAKYAMVSGSVIHSMDVPAKISYPEALTGSSFLIELTRLLADHLDVSQMDVLLAALNVSDRHFARQALDELHRWAELGQLTDQRAAAALVAYSAEKDLIIKSRNWPGPKSEFPQAMRTLTRVGPAAVPALIDVLRDGDNDFDRRKLSAWTLSRIGTPAVEPLIELMAADSADTREVAVWALGQIADPRALDAIGGSLMAGADDKIAHIALRALKAKNDPAAIAYVARACAHPSLSVRRSAQETLKSISRADPKRAVEPLSNALSDPNPLTRRAVADVLAKLGQPSAAGTLRRCLADEDPDVRKTAAVAMSRLATTDAAGDLEVLLRDEKGSVRTAAAGALATLGDRASVPALVEMLNDDSHKTRWSAVTALAAIGPPAIESLIHALKTPEQRFEYYHYAGSALKLIGSPAVEPLIEVVGDADAPGRARAIQVLAEIADPRARDMFVALLTDPEPRTRRQAAFALAHINDESAVGALEQMAAEDSDKACRAAAAKALKKLR